MANVIQDRCDARCSSLGAVLVADDHGSDVYGLFACATRYAGLPGYVFRGAGSSDYALHSTFDRSLETAGWKPSARRSARDLEELIFRQFLREAHLRIDHPPEPDDVLEWLGVMRHYGAPTRLLDWSYSIWVSLFFAAASAGPRGKASVWMLDSNWLDVASRAIARREGMGADIDRLDGDLHCRKRATFGAVYNRRSSKAPRFVLKQNCWRTNPRLLVQRGVFLCPSDISACFQSNLLAVLQDPTDGALDRPRLRRLDFDSSCAPKILERLHSFGISYASLYPDIEGLGKALNALPKIAALHANDLEFHGIGHAEPTRRS